MELRKELDSYTLDEIESREQLEKDCNYIKNIKNQMKQTSVNRLEELRLEFIKTNHVDREKQVFVNQIFAFLKTKA